MNISMGIYLPYWYFLPHPQKTSFKVAVRGWSAGKPQEFSRDLLCHTLPVRRTSLRNWFQYPLVNQHSYGKRPIELDYLLIIWCASPQTVQFPSKHWLFSTPRQANLVGGLEHLDYFSHHIGNVIVPFDFHIFHRGCFTTNQKFSVAEFSSGWRGGLSTGDPNRWEHLDGSLESVNPAGWILTINMVMKINESLVISDVIIYKRVFYNGFLRWFCYQYIYIYIYDFMNLYDIFLSVHECLSMIWLRRCFKLPRHRKDGGWLVHKLLDMAREIIPRNRLFIQSYGELWWVIGGYQLVTPW